MGIEIRNMARWHAGDEYQSSGSIEVQYGEDLDWHTEEDMNARLARCKPSEYGRGSRRICSTGQGVEVA